MKIFKQNDRDVYIETQIKRSEQKFNYCKVSVDHVYAWNSILLKNKITTPKRILCMGTRNGREVDLFRYVFFHPFLARLTKFFEVEKDGWRCLFSLLEGFFRSDIKKLSNSTVFGCEINPQAKRSDILIGSFDELPAEWEAKFDLIYSNSFDQSIDPHKTATEWRRCLIPGGCVVIGFADSPPTETDPVGDIAVNDLLELFPGELIFYGKNYSNYHDVVIRL